MGEEKKVFETHQLQLKHASLHGEVVDVGQVQSDEAGVLHYENGQEVALIAQKFSCGEPMMLLLKGEGIEREAMVVPHPLVMENTTGQRVEAILNDGDGRHYLVRFQGFSPLENIQVETQLTHGRVYDTSVVADVEGKAEAALDFSHLEEHEGVFQVTATPAKGNPVVLTHVWGQVALVPHGEIDGVLGR